MISSYKIQLLCSRIFNFLHQISDLYLVLRSTQIYLKFDKGQIAHGTVGYDLEYQNFYSIWGEKGFLQISRAYNIPYNMKPKISITNHQKIISHYALPSNHFVGMIDNFTKICTNSKKIFNEEKDLLFQALIMDYGRKSSHLNKFLKIKYPKMLK